MTPNDVVDIAEGLVAGMRGTSATVLPPFVLVVPYGTDLEEQYRDGRDDLGTLKERLLRIGDVRDVRVSGGTGVSIEHYEET